MKYFIMLLFFLSFTVFSNEQGLIVKFDLSGDSYNLLLINESDRIVKIQSSLVFNDCKIQHGFCIEYKDPKIEIPFTHGGNSSYEMNLWPQDIWGTQLNKNELKRLFPSMSLNFNVNFRIIYFLSGDQGKIKSSWYQMNLKNYEIKRADKELTK